MKKKRWQLGEKSPLDLLCFQGEEKKILCFDKSKRLSSKPGLSHETVRSLNIIKI